MAARSLQEQEWYRARRRESRDLNVLFAAEVQEAWEEAWKRGWEKGLKQGLKEGWEERGELQNEARRDSHKLSLAHLIRFLQSFLGREVIDKGDLVSRDLESLEKLRDELSANFALLRRIEMRGR